MVNKNYKRPVLISLFVIMLTFWNFTRIVNSDCIRAIHVVTLLACGAAIGVLLLNLIALLRNK
jgi:hypothetical protein